MDKEKKWPIQIILLIAILGIIIGAYYTVKNKSNSKPTQPIQQTQTPRQQAANMKLTSSAFENNQSIPEKYSCDGENINPPLVISEVPENTKSLSLIVDDPDAPAGIWVHWIVINIDPKTTLISENTVPVNSIEGTTSFGKPGYGGPCPPSGTHRYFFKLYALDTKLTLDQNAKKEDVEKAMQGHIVGQAELIGLYSRSQK